MELRGYRAEDRGTLARLARTAFGDAGSPDYWTRYFDPENPRLDPGSVHVIEEDGEARATATVLPLEAFVNGEPVPMGGVAAVTAHPAYRRRGYAGELMRAALRGMREKSTHLSMLWPFSHAFYRVYGWELAGESISYTLKPTDLPTSAEQKRVRAYRDEDRARMMELFDREAARHALCVRRDENRWREYLGRESKEAAVYEREDGVEGYVIYGMSPWGSEYPYRTLTVSEVVAATRRARQALISFMAAQDPLVFEIEYSTPRGEPLHPYLRSSHVKAEIEPQFMLRLVDVEGALNHLDRRISEPLVLDVSDDVIPENAGGYTIGGGGVLRGAEAAERVSLDVRQLAQLYAGYLPAREFARHGLVEPGSTRALELLEELFPPDDPWVSEPDHF